MKIQSKNYLIMLLLITVGLSVKAQTSYVVAPGTEFTVAGTSSLHDWTMTSQTAKGNAVVSTEDGELKGIEKLYVSINAETLKSGKSGMDDNAYKALNTKKHPEITFNLKEVKSVVKKDDYYLVNAEGTLTIAGESRTINVQGKAYPATNLIKFTGSKTFKMTDFKVDPPTAIFGTVKTGDEITINFTLTYKSKQS